jgi:hypothetical protein
MQDQISDLTDPRRREATDPLVNLVANSIRTVLCGTDDFVA